jgi:hypothetical protein
MRKDLQEALESAIAEFDSFLQDESSPSRQSGAALLCCFPVFKFDGPDRSWGTVLRIRLGDFIFRSRWASPAGCAARVRRHFRQRASLGPPRPDVDVRRFCYRTEHLSIRYRSRDLKTDGAVERADVSGWRRGCPPLIQNLNARSMTYKIREAQPTNQSTVWRVLSLILLNTRERNESAPFTRERSQVQSPDFPIPIRTA